MACCSVGDFDALIPLLDQEFIFGKGRRLSLAQRFPGTLDRNHPQNIQLASFDGSITSALVTKSFIWATPERSWSGSMIGMVYTRPDLRGRGTASALMRATQERLAQEGFDFAVLWTARPDFYARLGWLGIDRGTLGIAQPARAATSRFALPLGAADVAWIEALRPQYAPERVERTENTYATLLPHAERLELLRGDAAYMVLGSDDGSAFLYEMLGDSAEFPALWSRLAARYPTLYLNLPRGTPAERFLSAQGGITWQAQQLAMWLPLSATARGAHFADWYVPLLDRI